MTVKNLTPKPLTPAQIELMSELFPGLTDVRLEFRPQQMRSHKCSECDQDHTTIDPGGYFINGRRVSESALKDADEKLTRVMNLHKDVTL